VDAGSDKIKSARGLILKAAYREQKKRDEVPLNDVNLRSFLQKLSFKFARNPLKDLLDDLRERGYLTFTVDTDEDTGYELYNNIRVTPAGRDIVLGVKQDETILVG